MFISIQKVKFISNFFFLRYCKDIANLLFWEIWEWLIIPIKECYFKFAESFHAFLHGKINSIIHFLLKMMQRNSRLTPKMIVSL